MSPLKADKKAESLVPQIVKAHEELVEIEAKGFTTALTKAIELGVLLNLAKTTVYHGHWESWFNDHDCFRFSFRSANRYMNLARNREALEDALSNSPRVAKMAGEGTLSIRAAEGLLSDEDDDDNDSEDESEDDEFDADATTNNAGENAGSGGSGRGDDPDKAISEAAPDEIALVIKREWDDEKQLDLLRELFTSSPFRNRNAGDRSSPRRQRCAIRRGGNYGATSNAEGIPTALSADGIAS